MDTESPASFDQITNVLSQSLKTAFEEVSPERYGGPLSLQQLNTDDDTVSFYIEGADDIALHLHVTVSHVGGNVYDIAAQVEDRPAHQVTYSVPDSSGSSLSFAPYLGKKIARHLLNDVEQHLGRILLRRQMTSHA